MKSKREQAQLAVWLGATRVGQLQELPYDRILFTFHPEYVADRERPVLSFSFYDAHGSLDPFPIASQTKAPAFFANLLPEGDLRQFITSAAGFKNVRDLPLLQLLGGDLPGAVVVRPEGDGAPPQEWGKQETLPLAQSGEPLRFSLAGVQMKFSGAGSPQRGLTIPAGGRGGHWILKLPSQQYKLLPENEHSMMRFAKEAGMQVAETGLVPVADIQGIPERFRSDANALWVKRFDRSDAGDRIHMEDFNQLYSQLPDSKYDNYSYGNMLGDLARISNTEDVREFIRRLIFSAAIGNTDMHLKNWTLLYSDGRHPRLSPAYDFVSVISYIKENKLALSVHKEKAIPQFNDDLLQRFARALPVPVALVMDTAHETARKIVQTWTHLAPELPMDSASKARIDKQFREFPITAQFLQL